MKVTLFVTSYKQICESFQLEFGLKSPKEGVYIGQGKNKYFRVLLVPNDKVKSTVILSEYLALNKDTVEKIVVVNPVNCPDPNVKMGTFIFGDKVTEWDRSIRDTSIYKLQSFIAFSMIFLASSLTSTKGSLKPPAGMPFTFIAYLIDEGFPSQNSALKNGASL